MIRGRAIAFLAAAATGITPVAAGCGGGATAEEPSAAEVTIKTFMFEPSPLTVEQGTTVNFTNEDEILHTVVAGTRDEPTGGFDEELDGPGATATVAFEEPGTFDYVCDIHAGMDGQVIVEAP